MGRVVHVTREVLALEAAEWLLVWQSEGWTRVTSPVQVGVTLAEQPVLRLTLATTTGEERSARSAPRESDVPAWVPCSPVGHAVVPGPRGARDRWPYDAVVPDGTA